MNSSGIKRNQQQLSDELSDPTKDACRIAIPTGPAGGKLQDSMLVTKRDHARTRTCSKAISLRRDTKALERALGRQNRARRAAMHPGPGGRSPRDRMSVGLVPRHATAVPGRGGGKPDTHVYPRPARIAARRNDPTCTEERCRMHPPSRMGTKRPRQPQSVPV